MRYMCLRYILPVLLLTAGRSALGHGLNVFAWTEGESIAGEVYFTGGGAAEDAKVTLLAGTGEKLKEAETGSGGNFRFSVRAAKGMVVVAETSDGHRAEYRFAGNSAGSQEKRSTGSEELPQQKFPQQELPQDSYSRLARKVDALRREFHMYRSSVKLRDIIGGLGWIAGLAGILFYIKARSREIKARSRERAADK